MADLLYYVGSSMEKGLLNSFLYGYFTYLGGPNSGVFQRAMVIVKSLYELDDPSLIPRGMDLFMQMMAVNFGRRRIKLRILSHLG